jgi:hypothetical protein
MPRRKSDYITGLEVVLNNPKTSFLKQPSVFNEIVKQSQMPIASVLKTIGKGKRNHKAKPPTDAERSEARLKDLEMESKK